MRYSYSNLQKTFNLNSHRNSEIKHSISDQDLLTHLDFFITCAKDYQQIASQLINELARHLDIIINSKSPMLSFGFLKNCADTPAYTRMGDWEFQVHGFHCSFKHQITGQCISASLVNGLDYGTLDPLFFIEFIKSTPEYKPLPIAFLDSYTDGVKILNKLLEHGIN